MKKNESSTPSIRSIDRALRAVNLNTVPEPDETLTGRLGRVISMFAVIRPLLVALTVFPILPTTSRSVVTMFLQSLDALSALATPGDATEVQDFKAGRDL
ncbi:MAG TPA: hypothetical protein VGF28_09190 [Thermoanaerobaculia bacterium]|jgi:hypothetical protein